jgi:type II secretion system protein L
VATPRDASGQAVAAVVDRALLRRALEIFARAGRRVVQATPQPLALGMSPGGWRVRWRDGRGSVRTEVFTGMGFESNDSPPLELRLLLAQSAERPSVIDVEGECDAQAWSEALGVPVRKVNATTGQARPMVMDLLQYEFSGGIIRWPDWRATIVLGAALLLVSLGGLNLHAWALRAEESALRDQMAAVLLETFPQVPVVLDPLAQMRRLAADLRTAAGTGSDDFLSSAAVLGRIADTDSVQSMEYRDGRLSVRFRAPFSSTQAEREALARRATEAGMTLRFDGDNALFTMAEAP